MGWGDGMSVEGRFTRRDWIPEWYKRMCTFFGWDMRKAKDVKERLHTK